MRVRAPELPSTLPWLNCDRPLSLKELRGQGVILDFWTYGCINCQHVLPDLQGLEARYRDRLKIIGIHTAKFDHEQSPEAVEQAIWRYGITHPVLVDCDRQLWNAYTIRAWPTLVVIDPQGYIVSSRAGEGQLPILTELIASFASGYASSAPVLELPDQSSLSPLWFPGKVLADADSDSLFIADTGHHRVVITTLSGTLKTVIGTGEAGWVDGEAAIAQFHSPQGMAWDRARQTLYVTDTGNHLIRQIDLQRQQVKAIAGTGTQSRILFPHGGRALETDLNSPWDLALIGSQLWIAMAGSHQIWLLDLASGAIATYLGTGAEFCVDGDGRVAAFAQPSGLTTNGQTLFVADSESSSIRAIALGANPTVQTLCGSGQLFGFGDRDGMGKTARLQHCLGLTYAEDALWITDTYNHKIKRVHPQTGECQSVFGSGKSGFQDGTGNAAQLAEPSGLSYTQGCLYVADTNNHAIRRLELSTGTVTTLNFPDLCSPFVCLPPDPHRAMG